MEIDRITKALFEEVRALAARAAAGDMKPVDFAIELSRIGGELFKELTDSDKVVFLREVFGEKAAEFYKR